MDIANTNQITPKWHIRGFLTEVKAYPSNRPIIHEFLKQFLSMTFAKILVRTQEIWYLFENHRWIPFDAAATFWPARIKELCEWTDQCLKMDNLDANTRLILKTCSETYAIASQRSELISQCDSLFFNPEFKSSLDTNKYLMCFTNGVLNLTTGILCPGQPYDRFRRQFKYPYVALELDAPLEDTNISNLHDELWTFLHQIQPNLVALKILLDCLASCLDPDLTQSQWYCWTGIGSSDKSTLMSLVRKTFEQYYWCWSEAHQTEQLDCYRIVQVLESDFEQVTKPSLSPNFIICANSVPANFKGQIISFNSEMDHNIHDKIESFSSIFMSLLVARYLQRIK